MSEQRNVETVRRFLDELWIKRNPDAALECAHPEIEMDWSSSRAPYKGTYTGHEGVRRFWTSLWDAWDEFRVEIEDVIECGQGRLITATSVRARGKTSGIEIAAGGALLWTLRGGKIIHGKLFQTKQEALDATALRR